MNTSEAEPEKGSSEKRTRRRYGWCLLTEAYSGM